MVGYRVVEIGGVGPTPFATMLLADLGADVVKIERPGGEPGVPRPRSSAEILLRGKRSVALDLKNPHSVDICLQLIERADVAVEGFRPGVAERLGLGPKQCHERNPKLIYGRMTGWGQDGPLSSTPGFDINYVSVAGALQPMGYRDRPPLPPLNLVGDFGGGGMLLAFGLVSAIVGASGSGRGQVVDASMVDGIALLMAQMHSFYASGEWTDTREANILDGGAPFYSVYECGDGQYVSVAAVEPSFYTAFLNALGLLGSDLPPQWDRQHWPATRQRFADVIATKTRDEWCQLSEGTDACVTPVLSPMEAFQHPHNQARNTFVSIEGVVQPAPAPKFSDTPGAIHAPPPQIGEHTGEVLHDWLAWDDTHIVRARETGATFDAVK